MIETVLDSGAEAGARSQGALSMTFSVARLPSLVYQASVCASGCTRSVIVCGSSERCR